MAKTIDLERYAVQPEGLAVQRAAGWVALEGSEDARSVLEHPRLPKPSSGDAATDEVDEWKRPEPKVEWLVSCALAEPVEMYVVEDALTEEMIDALSTFGPFTVYLRNAETGAFAPFDPEGVSTYAVDSVVVAFPYVPPRPDDDEDETGAVEGTGAVDEPREIALRDAEQYAAALEFAAALLDDLGASQVDVSFAPVDAARHEAALRKYRELYGRTIAVALRAEPGASFTGRAVWDVMMSLGLSWGTEDLFWCRDPERPEDSMFAVATTTDPGYFSPQAIAEGKTYDDLVFYATPACFRDPPALVEVLSRAVTYVAARLGGVVVDPAGSAIDWPELVAEATKLARILTDAGLAPGTRAGLALFE